MSDVSKNVSFLNAAISDLGMVLDSKAFESQASEASLAQEDKVHLMAAIALLFDRYPAVTLKHVERSDQVSSYGDARKLMADVCKEARKSAQ